MARVHIVEGQSEGTYYAFSAALRIADVPNLHSAISRRLEVEPTRCHVAGDLAAAATGRRWPNSVWVLESPLPESARLNDHLRWLCPLLTTHRDFLRSLVESGAAVDVFCGYRSTAENAGFEIEPDVLEALSRAGCRLSVSVMVWLEGPTGLTES